MRLLTLGKWGLTAAVITGLAFSWMVHGVFFGRLNARGLARQRLTHVVRQCSNWKPASFNETFKIPARNQPLHLETKHFHPIDQHLSFDEQSHKYRFDNKPLRLSVTQVVGNYFEKFVPEEAVRIMMNGSNWPRPQYCDVNGVPHTAEQIMQEWEQIGEKARNEGMYSAYPCYLQILTWCRTTWSIGTYMHWNIERHLNDLEITAAIPEFKQYLQFYHDNILAAKIRPYRTEWRIAAPDLGLGGSVDFVGQREDGSFVLMDWKRSKNLPFSMYKAYGKYGR